MTMVLRSCHSFYHMECSAAVKNTCSGDELHKNMWAVKMGCRSNVIVYQNFGMGSTAKKINCGMLNGLNVKGRLQFNT